MQNKKIDTNFLAYKSEIDEMITHFDTKGIPFVDQDRNSLKRFDLNGKSLIIKSFKVPNRINQIAYRFFRKSKAQRSFEYAKKLTDLGIGTPQPVAYYEFKTALFFKKSYYASEQVECELTYRELTQDLQYPNHEEILRAFTRFTFKLHQNNVLFLDHSPGNTLIKKTKKGYDFFLVDLNRMEFKSLTLDERIKNFSRLTIHKSMVEVMSDEYAKISNEPYDLVFELMWKYTEMFQEKYWKKQRLKQKLKLKK